MALLINWFLIYEPSITLQACRPKVVATAVNTVITIFKILLQRELWFSLFIVSLGFWFMIYELWIMIFTTDYTDFHGLYFYYFSYSSYSLSSRTERSVVKDLKSVSWCIQILRFALNDKKEKSVSICVICGALSLSLKDSRVSHSIHIGDDGTRIIRYLVTPADEAVAIVGHGD